SELAFGLENEGRLPEEIQRRVADTVEALHLQELQRRSIFSLSGGQKQLLAFGSVYAMGPEVFVLDEPTANLDQDAIARLHDQIACLKHQGRTVVIAEHRLYFLTDLIDRALYLRDGVLEHTFNREQFCGLTEQEREELGLRTLTPAACTLPAVAPAGTKEGLSVEGLTCAYRKEPAVFQGLSFSARPGEVVSITGPNGVGKTTLSRCLCGLIREQAGQIRLDGRHLNRKERQKAAFCVMQDVNHQLFSDSVWGECRMSTPDAPDSTVEEVLDSLHLLPFRERHPMSLSGGQKQRLAVATALLSEKPILIFDEPTSGLDYARMVEVSGVIRNLAQQGRIVLVVTHDREFMQRSCDRVLRL
uniref:energy-coupling factor ABC transporter ATP-binding protein n=1 Tax=Evtepia gabavorous TaxID=2211183 RepID=UPI003A941FC5